jgi:hypothetical protein
LSRYLLRVANILNPTKLVGFNIFYFFNHFIILEREKKRLISHYDQKPF